MVFFLFWSLSGSLRIVFEINHKNQQLNNYQVDIWNFVDVLLKNKCILVDRIVMSDVKRDKYIWYYPFLDFLLS